MKDFKDFKGCVQALVVNDDIKALVNLLLDSSGNVKKLLVCEAIVKIAEAKLVSDNLLSIAIMATELRGALRTTDFGDWDDRLSVLYATLSARLIALYEIRVWKCKNLDEQMKLTKEMVPFFRHNEFAAQKTISIIAEWQYALLNNQLEKK